jgi:RNA polymerase sigma factor (sigma-70 family)
MEPDGPPDEVELIAAVRAGRTAAYQLLYQRHAPSATGLARQLARSPSEVDDLVSEAFAKVLARLLAGRGPDFGFRSYLLTTLRRTAYDRTRRDKRLEFTGDDADLDPGVPFTDTALADLERSLVRRAFRRLPVRWREVLWRTEIEERGPAEIGAMIGMTANSVSALAYRAREGLRQAYLQVHLAETEELSASAAAQGQQAGVELAQRCRATAQRLGAWIRDGLSRRDSVLVREHLQECDRCRALAVELAHVNSGLRGVVAQARVRAVHHGARRAIHDAGSGAGPTGTGSAGALSAVGPAAAPVASRADLAGVDRTGADDLGADRISADLGIDRTGADRRVELEPAVHGSAETAGGTAHDEPPAATGTTGPVVRPRTAPER